MGLFTSLFGRRSGQSQRRDGRGRGAADEGDSESPESRAHLRRELVHVVLRETMRSRGVPSDWLTAMVLPLPGQGRRGVHVLLVVRQGHEQMLAYVPAFQRSFFAALRQFDVRASEWMAGLSWQFEGMPDHVGAATLPPLVTGATGAASPAAASSVAAVSSAADAEEDEDLQEDLRALFAIRDEAMQAPDSSPMESEFQSTQPDFQPTQPLR